ncbi:ATP-binding protein [Ekhidna sp. MALMAid0563]|uniref:ATP-binding protein n=1 Tax=Ekhidna sp. MALMAid0563 TaxID=3143937 RepID=UPI0032DF3B7F
MSYGDLILKKINGYAGIRLLNGQPLKISPGINLLVGRNGSGKTNLLRLIHFITSENGDISKGIESSFFNENAKRSLKSNNTNLINEFGEIPIIKYTFRDKQETINLSLSKKQEIIPAHFLNNIKNSNSDFNNYIDISKPTFKSNWLWIHNDNHSRKFELTGRLFNSVLYRNNEKNEVSSLFDKEVDFVNQFAISKMRQFFESDDFKNEINKLEQDINDKLHKFLGATKKTIKIQYDLNANDQIRLFLIDGENAISADHLSDGENVLLNLIFNLIKANDSSNDFIIFDEPELHMHDDMIKVLVKEIQLISNNLSRSKIIIATHSTALIEQLATSQIPPSLVLLDNKRRISNSTDDVDFVKALKRNGVWFTPLMLSKKRNLFIENLGSPAQKHRDFYEMFFNPENLPNIIPIGNSGNVAQSESFSNLLGDLVDAKSISSKGIQDGDIWLRQTLCDYFNSNINIDELINCIPPIEEMYISKENNNNIYYFNFWEIENLYLFDETIPFWEKNFTKEKFRKVIIQKKQRLSNEYLKTFFKLVTNNKFNSHNTIKEDLKKAIDSTSTLKEKYNDFSELEKKAELLVEEFVNKDLLHWLPGKELCKLLREENYTFNYEIKNLNNSKLGKKLQRILD